MKIQGLKDARQVLIEAGLPSDPPTLRPITAAQFKEQRGQGSTLEMDWGPRWCNLYPHLVFKAELVFSKTRQYRFDFAWPEAGVAVEIQGQIWQKGAHSSGTGITRDCQKILHAASLGWLTLPLTPEMARDPQVLAQVAKIIEGRMGQ
jgi:hypothetical protein